MATKNNSESLILMPRDAYGYCSVPLFLHSMVHGDVKIERDLVHVGDVVGLDLSVGNLVAAVGAKDGQLFFVIRWHLQRRNSPCADGEMAPFHKNESTKTDLLENGRSSCLVLSLLPSDEW